MTSEDLFNALVRVVRANVPPHVGLAYVDGFVARNRDVMVRLIEQNFGEALARKFPRSDLPELWSAAKRTAANLAAMKLLATKAPEAMDAADRRVVARYSGWGGLSITKVVDQFPAGFPVPETKGLLHEYYTPMRVWNAVERELRRWRDELPRVNGELHALEPSAGIGRALRAFADWTDLRWTALEVSPVSSKLLRALFTPSIVSVVEGYAERFFSRNAQTFGLIAANPPYGARGEAAELDPTGYRTAQAYIYFVMRAAEALAAGGIAVQIIPTGLLSSKAPAFVKHRTELLRRAHLMGAFRLPSQPPEGGTLADVGYDNFVVDVLFLRGRGGIAAAPPPEDLAIVEGLYYEQFPAHILGTPVGALAATDDTLSTGPKIRRGYQVVGRFNGFPAWSPRPQLELAVTPHRMGATRSRGGIVRADAAELPENTPTRLRDAVALGLRADRHLEALARGNAHGAAGGAELVRDLRAWSAAWGAPEKDASLRELAESGNVGARRFLTVLAGGRPAEGLGAKVDTPGFQAERNLLALTTWLYGQRGGLPLPIAELSAESMRQGLGRVDIGRVYAELWAQGWRRDGDQIEPTPAYLSGHLWPKHDRAAQLAGDDDYARRQVAELREAIGWTGGGKLVRESAPNQPWIPLDVLARFARDAVQWPADVGLRREDGLLMPEGMVYGALNNTDKGRPRGFGRLALCFIGWVNADKGLFAPPQEERLREDGTKEQVPVDELRLKLEAAWNKHWSTWLLQHDDVLTALEEAFNRTLRGYVAPSFSAEPVEISRWGSKVKLHSYQNEAVRKLVANRCGLLAFDVGLGKTYSGIATLAFARQEGWARRPVIIVPNTICWKWYRDVLKCLPDYRVVVIGANRRKVLRETNRPLSDEAVAKLPRSAWRWRSLSDSPDERAEKWTAFQAGLYDVALVTYSAFSRQQIDRAFVERYVAKNVAIRRAITLSLDQIEGEDGEKKTARKRTERSEADTMERVRGWVGAKLSPPKNWKYDSGIDWHALGIDFLMVDESQNFKNLFYSSREGSSDRAASNRAWMLDFRCASVREHSRGAGVVLLSATPMKNAATEFFNMLHLVNPAIWEQVGIADPEGFVNLFAEIQEKSVTTGDGKQQKQQVVTGFHHLDALKGVVYRWSTFKTAKQVGLRIPDVSRVMHIARASDEQREQFAELFGQLADIQDKIRTAARMASDPTGQAILRTLKQKKQGIHTRLYLAAVHPGLVGNDPSMQVAEAGPKLVQCVAAVMETRPPTCSTLPSGEDFCLNCGHVIFAENIKIHGWLRELLVKAGLRPDRIAILNAEEASDLEVRQQIAEQFNGTGEPTDEEYEPPRYDVVIANAVAYEGIDLQRRTCAIHHLDVPWEPATLQQRNGRGVRQGNRFGEVTLHFYFVQGSSEKHRLGKIERKRGIMASLFEEGAAATNTVEADSVEADDDIADAFVEFCPPHLRDQLVAAAEEDKKAREAEQRRSARIAANRALREALQANRRLQRVTSDDDARMAQLVAEAHDTRADLVRFPTALWPYAWHSLAAAAFDQEAAFVPEDGPPVFPGVRIGVGNQESIVTLVDDESRVWAINPRAGGTPRLWNPSGVDIDTATVDNPPAIWWEEKFPSYLPFQSPDYFNPALLARHGDAFVEILWSRIVRQFGSQRWYNRRPYVAGDGRLVVDEANAGLGLRPSTLPPTDAGWVRFLQLAPASGMKFGALQDTATAWWDRKLPRNLLSSAREGSLNPKRFGFSRPARLG